MHYVDIAFRVALLAVGVWLALELCLGMGKYLKERRERPVNRRKENTYE